MRRHENKLPTSHRQTMEEASAEAESRPLEFDPNARGLYIRTMLRDIQLWMSQGDSKDTIAQRIPEFTEQYPELFKKIVNNQDLTPINNMLTMLDKMGNGSISQHQASIVVGKKLVDRYVTPQLKGSNSHK